MHESRHHNNPSILNHSVPVVAPPRTTMLSTTPSHSSPPRRPAVAARATSHPSTRTQTRPIARSSRRPAYARPTASFENRRTAQKPPSTAIRPLRSCAKPAPSRTAPPLNTTTTDGGVPETDATHTNRLWKRVMTTRGRGNNVINTTPGRVMRPTAAWQAKVKGGPGAASSTSSKDSGIGSSGSTKLDTGSASRTRAKSSRASSASRSTTTAATTTTTLPAAKLSDVDFEAQVLNPRGISIDADAKSVTPFYHFGNDQPPDAEFYRQLPGLAGSALWLDPNDTSFVTDVVREYASMRNYKLCEAEFAAYATETLLKREIRNPSLPESRTWWAERLVQLTARPDKAWAAPPFIDDGSAPVPRKAYAFTMRPDCAYWISLQAFNPDYRKRVKEYVSVRLDRILCPYLTIEFKKDDTSVGHARNQVAAAASVALYNRWRVRAAKVAAAKQRWSERYTAALRHYGLTFTGDTFEVWCVTATVDTASGEWKGCCMRRLWQDAFDTPGGVRMFVSWSNEIHRWGLAVHGPACERDIKVCMRSTPGADRTSLDGEDLESEGE